MVLPRESWKVIAAVFRRDAPSEDGGNAIAAATSSDQRDGLGTLPENADPLHARMRAMHLDPNEVLNSGNPVANELPRLCARCESRGRCMRDLVDEFADPAWQAWRNYCPNATTLSVLSTLHGCDEIEPKSG